MGIKSDKDQSRLVDPIFSCVLKGGVNICLDQGLVQIGQIVLIDQHGGITFPFTTLSFKTMAHDSLRAKFG